MGTVTDMDTLTPTMVPMIPSTSTSSDTPLMAPELTLCMDLTPFPTLSVTDMVMPLQAPTPFPTVLDSPVATAMVPVTDTPDMESALVMDMDITDMATTVTVTAIMDTVTPSPTAPRNLTATPSLTAPRNPMVMILMITVTDMALTSETGEYKRTCPSSNTFFPGHETY